MCRECREFSKNRQTQKKVVCYHFENEFSTFSTLYMSSYEFSTRQLDTLILHVDVNLHLTLPTCIECDNMTGCCGTCCEVVFRMQQAA